jgi:hypothetical protein
MRGGTRIGGGRPLGALNKATKEIRVLLAPLGEPAGARLGKLIECGDDNLAFEACELVLSCLHGRPRVGLDLEVEPKRQTITPEQLEKLELSDAQLRYLAEIA